jgi:hypothetical protein
MKFTVRSYAHPLLPFDQIEEAYFNSIRECQDWSAGERERLVEDEEMDVNSFHFEIYGKEITFLKSTPGSLRTAKWIE